VPWAPHSYSVAALSIRSQAPPPIYNTMPSSDAQDDHSRSASPDDSGGEQEGGDMAEHAERRERPEHAEHREDASHQNGHKSASNAKDPLRPRRKKARRACFACQRAHLTCGMSG
jgi:hypothetical protein